MLILSLWLFSSKCRLQAKWDKCIHLNRQEQYEIASLYDKHFLIFKSGPSWHEFHPHIQFHVETCQTFEEN